MPPPIDITGRRFGRLTALHFVGSRLVGTQRKRVWRLRCDCGQEVDLVYSALLSGQTRSCGCLLRETITKHGGYKTKLYAVWHAMLMRCTSATDPSWPHYGGRGIAVCARWQDFALFREDMGPRPPGGTLERCDVDGPYSPDNCRWASPVEQANNRRNNRWLTIAGETLTLAQWARRAGITQGRLNYRLSHGWQPETAIAMQSDRSASNVMTKAK